MNPSLTHPIQQQNSPQQHPCHHSCTNHSDVLLSKIFGLLENIRRTRFWFPFGSKCCKIKLFRQVSLDTKTISSEFPFLTVIWTTSARLMSSSLSFHFNGLLQHVLAETYDGYSLSFLYLTSKVWSCEHCFNVNLRTHTVFTLHFMSGSPVFSQHL